MPIARVQGNVTNEAALTNSVAVTISAVASGNTICGMVSWFSTTQTLTGVADNQGNTYNLETTATDTVDNQNLAAFSRSNITNGPTTITATFSGNVTFRKIIVDEFSGTSTASTDERDSTAHGGQYQASPGTGTDAITSGAFTTTVNGDLLYGACISAATTTLASNGTSFSTGTQNGTDYAGQTEFRQQATAGAGTAATFTQASNASRVTFLIAIKDDGTGPAAAVEFIGAGALAGNNTVATQAIASHANTAIDDILICQLINKSVTANTFSPPDGTWTEVITQEVNDCTTAAADHQYGLYWKRCTVAGAQNYTFTKANDDNLLFAGVISSWRGCATSGSPLDATAAARTETAADADNVTFPAFDPTATDAHVIYMAYYGNDLTTFNAAMSADTNPDCTLRYDLETATGNDCTLACISGATTDGSNIASRTWASASTTDAGNTGVVFALVPDSGAPAVGQPTVARMGGIEFAHRLGRGIW